MAPRRRRSGSEASLSERSLSPSLDPLDGLLRNPRALDLELARIQRLGEMEAARIAAAGPSQIFNKVADRKLWGPKEWERPRHVRIADKHKLDWQKLYFGMEHYGPPIRGRVDRFLRSWVCAQRLARQEVLFATKRTGKGARSRRRRNERSNIQCR